MMKPIALEQMTEYAFLSQLHLSDKGQAVYAVTRMNREKNRYDSALWLLDEEPMQLAAENVGSFVRWDKEEILFSADREEDKEKPEITRIYRIHPAGGEARLWHEFPFALTDLRRIDEEWCLVQASWKQELFKDLPEEERKERLEEEKDYEVLDEIPYWLNGGGFTNKKRSRLFLYNLRTGDKVPVTDAFTDVQSFDYSPERREVLAICVSFTDKMPLQNTLERIDLDTLEVYPLGFSGVFSYADAKYFNDGVIFSGSDMKKQGVNQDADLYVTDYEGTDIKRLSPEDWDVSLWNSVGSDVRYGSGYQTRVDGEYYYFITTEENSSYLNRIDPNGKIERVTENPGSVDFFDVKDGVIITCALRGQNLQELYKLEDGAEVALTCHNPMADAFVQAPEEFSFTSGDKDFTGYVLLPYDYQEGETYPGILAIHGGPKTAYGSVFYHELQYFAGQGYFVFFTNPTGSDGLGREMADIRGKYGEVDYDNLMDFTDAVLKRYPALDEDHLGVMGGSYGGFMTNWIIGHTERFSAAVSQRSISNWISKFGITDIGYYFVDDQQGGTPWNNPEGLWYHSPLKYANRAKTPTLFIHSDEDYRCHLSCGLQMFTALKYHGVEARLVMFRGENHELSRSGKPKHRIRRLKEMSSV